MTQAFIMWKQGTGRNRLITFRFLSALVLCGVTGVPAFANTPVDDVSAM